MRPLAKLCVQDAGRTPKKITADLEEDEEEDDLCLLFFLDLCLLSDWSLRDGLVCEECLSFNLRVLGDSTIMLRSDICEKSGSSGNIILLDVVGFGNSCANECSDSYYYCHYWVVCVHYSSNDDCL